NTRRSRWKGTIRVGGKGTVGGVAYISKLGLEVSLLLSFNQWKTSRMKRWKENADERRGWVSLRNEEGRGGRHR
ncbi:hypothetical protein PENTCL1PPCAC_24193, partial [Pristionchus entomophagus]